MKALSPTIWILLRVLKMESVSSINTSWLAHLLNVHHSSKNSMQPPVAGGAFPETRQKTLPSFEFPLPLSTHFFHLLLPRPIHKFYLPFFNSTGSALPWRVRPISIPYEWISNLTLAIIRQLSEILGFERTLLSAIVVVGTATVLTERDESGVKSFSTSMKGIAGDRHIIQSSSAYTVTRWSLEIDFKLWWRLEGTTPAEWTHGRPSKKL